MAYKCKDSKCDKPIKVSFCPKCKSRDVKYVFGLGNLFGVLPKMRCNGCGNEMPSFPLLITSKKLLEESDKAKKKKAVKKKTAKKKTGGSRSAHSKLRSKGVKK